MTKTKNNPYREYALAQELYRIDKIRDGLSEVWDFMNEEHLFRVEPASLVTTLEGTSGTVSLWNLVSNVSYATGIGAENFSYALAPVNFEEVEFGIKKSCKDFERRGHLVCLPTIRKDPVAIKLEQFFDFMCQRYPIASFHPFGLPVNTVPLAPWDESVLRNIAQSYRRLVLRTMKEKEYEHLAKISYEEFVDEGTRDYLSIMSGVSKDG